MCYYISKDIVSKVKYHKNKDNDKIKDIFSKTEERLQSS